MSFTDNQNSYCSFNKIGYINQTYSYANILNLNLNNSSDIQTYYSTTLPNERLNRVSNSLFYNNQISLLNTTVLSDMLVDIDMPSENTYPELGMLFIKSYLKQLIPTTLNGVSRLNIALSYENIYKLFNKNQELVELPYSVVLYLGGLYYFQSTIGQNNLRSQSGSYLFPRINGIKSNKPGITDIYTTSDLYRTPTRAKNTSDSQTYLPSTQVLNRFVYLDGDTESGEESFNIVTGVDINNDEIITSINIDTFNIMPPIGYGIQNRSLNAYNNYIFGDYLNGSYYTDPNNNGLPYNDGMPHVISGCYSGILKPIKTYDSNFMEFTALYRNPYVGNFSYEINDLVNEFTINTKGITYLDVINGGISNTTLTNIQLCFITYSKLKAMFLSGLLTNTNSGTYTLTNYITQLCNIKPQISSVFGSTLKNYQIPDFYYLLSHFFFASFKPEANYPNYKYDINNRLNFKLDDINNGAYRQYQKNALTAHLDQILNVNFINAVTTLNNQSDITNQLISGIVNFLSEIWSLEYYNIIDDYKTVDSQSVFALYPSAGGYITPQGLINNLNNASQNALANINYIDNSSGNLKFSLYTPKSNYDIGYGNIYTYFNGYNMYNCTTNQNDILSNINSSNIIQSYADQRVGSYIIDLTFNNNYFFNNTCYSNEAILKNTNRLIWFDTTDYGELLKLDRNPVYGFYQEFVSGSDIVVYNPSTGYTMNYFGSNYLNVDSYDNYNTGITYGYNEQFRFSNLLDSLDFEKLNEFQNMFLSFCGNSPNSQLNDDTFNLKSLVMATTFVSYNDILLNGAITDIGTNITLTPDQINLILIGNSMYQYDFVSTSRLSIFMNMALTNTQLKNFTDVTRTFCSQNITISNFSPMGSIAFDSSDNTPTISAHLFGFSPDVLFSDATAYTDYIANYTNNDNTITEQDIDIYLTRKILFADQYINPYVQPTDISYLITLNNLYLKNSLYTINQTDIINNKIDLDDLYATIVLLFFQKLNIEFSESLYKQLFRMIRTYTMNILTQLNLINSNFIPGNPILSSSDFIKIINTTSVNNGYAKTTPANLKGQVSTDTAYVNDQPINPMITY